jgi:plastocyanin
MRLPRGVRVASGLAAFLAAACRGPAPAPRHHQIAIESLAFSPATLVVRRGDTVTWTNRDIVPHTATGPESSWDSGYLAAGADFMMVVGAEAGGYRCAYHPTMTGTLSSED